MSAFRVKLGANNLNCVDVPFNPTHSLTHDYFPFLFNWPIFLEFLQVKLVLKKNFWELLEQDFLPFGCPTNSISALKAESIHQNAELNRRISAVQIQMPLFFSNSSIVGLDAHISLKSCRFSLSFHITCTPVHGSNVMVFVHKHVIFLKSIFLFCLTESVGTVHKNQQHYLSLDVLYTTFKSANMTT